MLVVCPTSAHRARRRTKLLDEELHETSEPLNRVEGVEVKTPGQRLSRR
jgi:hypothetical protein